MLCILSCLFVFVILSKLYFGTKRKNITKNMLCSLSCLSVYVIFICLYKSSCRIHTGEHIHTYIQVFPCLNVLWKKYLTDHSYMWSGHWCNLIILSLFGSLFCKDYIWNIFRNLKLGFILAINLGRFPTL